MIPGWARAGLAGWRQAGGRLEGDHLRIYTFLAKLEAGLGCWRQAGGRLGWRQAGGRLEGDHLRIYTFLAKLEAGLGGVSRSLTKHKC